ncbi:hypothetical protein niasHT_018985 [Heterodera trifolii]|uniref:Uncharacterized protein n=1 Tax=Heterodera trifolii TaxID=157864 RepID=A0ABD2LJ74_9BILA
MVELDATDFNRSLSFEERSREREEFAEQMKSGSEGIAREDVIIVSDDTVWQPSEDGADVPPTNVQPAEE